MSAYYLGVDGGGSKTTAVVCDEDGQIIKSCIGKSINYYSIGNDEARANMSEIIRNLGIDRYAAAFIGMSALSERADRGITQSFAEDVIPCEDIVMDSDLFIALESLSVDGACAVVISGTGSMAAGRTESGEILHTGGWGYILGDEGSGYAVSLNAVRASLRSYDGVLPPTQLLSAAIKHFGVETADGLIDKFYNPTISRTEIASFASAVFAAASSGDVLAEQIILTEASELAKTTAALLTRLPPDIPVGLWGGLFEHHALFRNAFCSILKKETEASSVEILKCPAVCGALSAALKLSGVKINDSIVSNIECYGK